MTYEKSSLLSISSFSRSDHKKSLEAICFHSFRKVSMERDSYLNQVAPKERKPPPCIVWLFSNSLAGPGTVYPKLFKIVSCVMSDLS